MSRDTRARRLARKARPKNRVPEPTGTWGDGPALTAEEQARVLARFSSLKGRSCTIGFAPLVADGWVPAQSPEALEVGTRELIAERSKGGASN